MVLGEGGQRTANSISFVTGIVGACWLVKVEFLSTQHPFPFRNITRSFNDRELSLDDREFSHFFRQYILLRQIIIQQVLILTPTIIPEIETRSMIHLSESWDCILSKPNVSSGDLIRQGREKNWFCDPITPTQTLIRCSFCRWHLDRRSSLVRTQSLIGKLYNDSFRIRPVTSTGGSSYFGKVSRARRELWQNGFCLGPRYRYVWPNACRCGRRTACIRYGIITYHSVQLSGLGPSNVSASQVERIQYNFFHGTWNCFMKTIKLLSFRDRKVCKEESMHRWNFNDLQPKAWHLYGILFSHQFLAEFSSPHRPRPCNTL